MNLTDLRLLLKHAPAMRGVEVSHPDNCTSALRTDLWMMVRWSHTQERFGDMSTAQIAAELASREVEVAP